MAIVMPRARSSGALSMLRSRGRSASFLRARTFVIAAVSVVLPWSTWPMVPTLRCGFVLSNFAFAICFLSLPILAGLYRQAICYAGDKHRSGC